MRQLVLAPVGLGVAACVALAGCGRETGAVKSCWKARGLQVSRNDIFTDKGKVDAFDLDLGSNHALVDLNHSKRLAIEDESTQRAFAVVEFSTVEDPENTPQKEIRRKGNAVIVWDYPPTRNDRTAVDNCLD